MGYTGQLPEHKKYDKKGNLREPEDELLDSLIGDPVKSLCDKCKHLNKDKVSCKAFPRLIPREFLLGEALHNKPYEGDKGIRFEEKPKK